MNEIHQVFINHVKENRGDRLVAEDATLFSGQYWTAETGQKLGLVDGIDNMDNYITKKWGKSGNDVNIHEIKHQRKSLFENLLDNFGVSTCASMNSVFSKLALTEQFNAMNMDIAIRNCSDIYC